MDDNSKNNKEIKWIWKILGFLSFTAGHYWAKIITDLVMQLTK